MDVREKLVDLLDDMQRSGTGYFGNAIENKKIADYLISNGVTIAVAVAKCVTIDAVPVVRCRECGHGMPCVDGYVRCSHPSGKSILMKSSDFCSYGERKEGAE